MRLVSFKYERFRRQLTLYAWSTLRIVIMLLFKSLFLQMKFLTSTFAGSSIIVSVSIDDEDKLLSGSNKGFIFLFGLIGPIILERLFDVLRIKYYIIPENHTSVLFNNFKSFLLEYKLFNTLHFFFSWVYERES